MGDLIHFVPKSNWDATSNLREFVELMRALPRPLGLDVNRFENHAWSVTGLCAKGGSHRFIYFVRLDFDPRKNSPRRGAPAVIPDAVLLRAPFLEFAKGLTAYLHGRKTSTVIATRIIALRFLEASLLELAGTACPTATTPEVMYRAQALAADVMRPQALYGVCLQLTLIYESMNDLRLLAAPSVWRHSAPSPSQKRNRVGRQFDIERQTKLPSPLVLNALAEIFNSDTSSLTEIFASSLCALMLCAPDRSVEALYAPADIFAPDWQDPDTGEVGTGLRWYPVKGAAPMIKTVIPSMRVIAQRAVEKLLCLSKPARELACWYEKNPEAIFLPTTLEHLRNREQLNRDEVHAILFGPGKNLSTVRKSNRVYSWLKAHNVPKQVSSRGTSVLFADLERAVVADLPLGFPIMDAATGMRYSDALCLIRLSEFDSVASSPINCCFDRIKYVTLKTALKSCGGNKSIFEKRGYRDLDERFLSLSSHMLRHYLNTLIRQSGSLTEEDIARWSGRKNVRQNTAYNHVSDRDVLMKLRTAVGDPALSKGPFANIDKRIFVRREQFASIKVLTAHTSEFGYCIHDFAQTPCQVYSDCINCSEQVCIKGDKRAEGHLRRMLVETRLLHEQAESAFDAKVLGAAEWFQHQAKTLDRIQQLVAILDDPNVPEGSAIQLECIESPSRLEMIKEAKDLLRHVKVKVGPEHGPETNVENQDG